MAPAPDRTERDLPWSIERGDGPLVALVHGGLDRSAGFSRVARHLDDCRVLRYGRWGYAHSRHLALGGIEEQVDDLLGLLAGRPATVVGHSVGAVVALAAAASGHGDIRSVGAFEPPMPWLSDWPRHTAGGAALREEEPAAAVERFMRRMLGDERWERLPAHTRADRRAEGPALQADLRAVRRAPFRLDQLTLPVVVGWGSATSPHHVVAAQHLAADLPRAEVHVIEGATHGAHLSHPAAFAGFVRHALRLATPVGPSGLEGAPASPG